LSCTVPSFTWFYTLSLHDALPIFTLVELAPRLCARVVPPVLSDYLKRVHERHGVEIRLGTATPPDADTIVVGVGVVPNVELAERSEEHTSELQSRENLVCRLLLEK